MGDVTIPHIMTEKPRCRQPPFYGQTVVKPRAQSKVQLIVVCVCYFLQKNYKANKFTVLQKPS